MTTGANEDDWHLRGVDVERDIAVTTWTDLREVVDGDLCVQDGGKLELWKAIEVGHIFKLGTKYSETFGAYVQDEAGESRPIVMGSYGIGLERGVAAVVESNHDEKGIVWPVSVAPYEVVLTVVRVDDTATMAIANQLYETFSQNGVEVLLDDREERPGVKFADAELVGIPFRVTIGPKGVAEGVAEVTERRGLVRAEVPLDTVVSSVSERVFSARHGISG